MKTAKDRQRVKGVDKTLRRLQARIKSWESLPTNLRPAYRCPGSRQK
jgi:hypothetical protein